MTKIKKVAIPPTINPVPISREIILERLEIAIATGDFRVPIFFLSLGEREVRGGSVRESVFCLCRLESDWLCRADNAGVC
jgi:hypothetical protein